MAVTAMNGSERPWIFTPHGNIYLYIPNLIGMCSSCPYCLVEVMGTILDCGGLYGFSQGSDFGSCKGVKDKDVCMLEQLQTLRCKFWDMAYGMWCADKSHLRCCMIQEVSRPPGL